MTNVNDIFVLAEGEKLPLETEPSILLPAMYLSLIHI